MIFSQKSIADIIAGKKTQTRRIVKEWEIPFINSEISIEVINGVQTRKNKIKWQVGKSYSVQSGRGKPCVWFCPKCMEIHIPNTPDGRCLGKCEEETLLYTHTIATKLKPLRIRIISVKKEKLLDISEEDAMKEGFEPDHNNPIGLSAVGKFWVACCKINHKDYIKDMVKQKWNPEVWAITFSVVMA